MTGELPRVAYQGEPGAYGEEALLGYFGEEVEPRPEPTFARVMGAVLGRAAVAALLPLENSQAGTVGDALDALLRTALVVTGEVILPVRHQLLGAPGARLEDVELVMSHWQALAQCERFLAAQDVTLLIEADTAGAARRLRDDGDRTRAVVASRRAAERYDLPVLAADIQDASPNLTRFAVVCLPDAPLPPARGPLAPPPDASCTSLVLFETLHRPGALHHALGALAEAGANLSRIESRPTGRVRWQYRFLVSVDGSAGEEPLCSAMEELARRAHAVRLLGSFPSGATS